MNLFLGDIVASDLSTQFKFSKREFLLKTLLRTMIFQRYSRFTKGTAMCKSAIVKEREKNAKRLTMKKVLKDQKYHEILQNFKILHAQSKLQG